MEEFYLAPRGKREEVLYLVSNWDLFLALARALSLPKLGLLLVPVQREVAREIAGVPLALDNGAFQLLKADFDGRLELGKREVERWLSAWLRAVESARWEWVALLDVPVHGRQFVESGERLRRVELTARLHLLSFEKASEIFPPRRLRAVLQGYEVGEYLYSLALHSSLLPLWRLDPVLAVGSVCVRKDSPLTNLAGGKARGTAGELRELLDAVDRPLHFFGLHGKFVRTLRSHPRFHSSDSGAAGAVFRWEIRDIKRRLGVRWEDRLRDYLLAHLVQYVRSTRGMDKKAWEALASLF